VRTGGGQDRYAQLLLVGERLLGMRAGVLHALDAASGRELWRFPREGTATTPNPHSGYFKLGIVGDCAVTELRTRGGERNGGVAAVRISDGELVRRFEPEFELPYRGACWQPSIGAQVVFSASSSGWRLPIQIMVFDLSGWREIARFELPRADRQMQATRSHVYGYFWREWGSPPWAFTVDVERGEMYSLPLPRQTMSPCILPDGSKLIGDWRLSARCEFEGLWPRSGQARVAGDGVYVRDERGLYRARPADGGEVWRFDPGGRGPWGLRDDIAAAGDVLAFYEGCHLFIIDAPTGSLRAGIRVLDDEPLEARDKVSVACDGARVCVAWPTGLRAYSTRPVKEATVDPEDPGDPAYSLARCRGALLAGDFEGALKAVRRIAVLTKLRPASREEAAELLSQLSRSPAVSLHPRLWTDIVVSEGGVAGSLFEEEMKKVAALLPRSGMLPPNLSPPEKAEKQPIAIERPKRPEVIF